MPLARARELLAAGEEEFNTAVADIDRRLRAEIRQRQRHRERIAQLAAGDSLVLPPEAVAYLDRLRELGLPDLMIEGERDAWILVAAQLIDWKADDPRVAAVGDRLAASLEAADARDGRTPTRN